MSILSTFSPPRFPISRQSIRPVVFLFLLGPCSFSLGELLSINGLWILQLRTVIPLPPFSERPLAAPICGYSNNWRQTLRLLSISPPPTKGPSRKPLVFSCSELRPIALLRVFDGFRRRGGKQVRIKAKSNQLTARPNLRPQPLETKKDDRARIPQLVAENSEYFPQCNPKLRLRLPTRQDCPLPPSWCSDLLDLSSRSQLRPPPLLYNCHHGQRSREAR